MTRGTPLLGSGNEILSRFAPSSIQNKPVFLLLFAVSRATPTLTMWLAVS